MKHSSLLKKTVVSTALTLLITPAFAGPGTLTDSPLFINATAAANIMFLVDNSLSMNMIAEESDPTDSNKYNSAIIYKPTCNSPVASGQTVHIFIDSNQPRVRFDNAGTVYTADYALAESATNICFDSTTNYRAGLNANNASGTSPRYTNNVALYSGNYLNWYFKFNNTTPAWNSGQEIKPGTQTRKTIASSSMTTLLTALEASDVDLRVGLASFNPSSGNIGVQIFNEIRLLDSTQLNSMLNNLAIPVPGSNTSNLGDGYGTPLGTSLSQIGRYFMGETGTAGPMNGSLNSATLLGPNDTNGSWDGNVTIHPDATASPPRAEVDDDDLLGYPPSYDYSSPNRESPIQYWCQNNFAVVMTDGLPSVDRNNISSYLQDYDSDCDGVSPACANTTTGAPSTTPHFDMKGNSSSYIYLPNNQSPSDYFDDVAQALYEIDLRPDINDFNGDPVKNNIITYTIAFADQDALSNQLIADTGTQGGGEAISAADGQDLIKKFTEVTNKILATTSSAAAVTFNTNSLGSDTAVYQSLFSTSRWSGEINAFPIIINTSDPLLNGSVDFSCIPDAVPNCWSASTHIDNLAYNSTTNLFVDNRQIITLRKAVNTAPNPDVVTDYKGIAFTTPVDFTAPTSNEITTAMINDLCAGPDAPLVSSVACTSATTSAKDDSQEFIDRMVDYIRGDRTFEDISTTPVFRTRQTVLGDIINGAPVFIGPPDFGWNTAEDPSNKFGVTGNRYSDFKTLRANRTKALYSSANDGMLHAFRTETVGSAIRELAGDELFAYMPSFLFSSNAAEGYHYLANPNYVHKYYLDLTPTFTDVFTKGKDASQPDFTSLTADWRTVLLGGSRGGINKGIFALDVTDPALITESNAANMVLWEFTENDDVDLGYTYSQPTIALTNAVDSDGLNRWAAIFGNGYQNDSSAVTGGTSCTAQLFIVFLDGGLDGTWTLGTDPDTADYMKIDTQVGTTAAGDCNGLSTPALADLDGDRILDRVYAGDVQGNMWVFDLTCSGPSCGTNDFDVAYTQGATPRPLFTTQDPSGNPQPIMGKPILTINARVDTTPSNQPNVLVLFGTGQYHAIGDNNGTSSINSFYGIWDAGTGELTDDRTGTTLVGQTLTTTTTAYGELRQITSNTIDWTTQYGWYVDLAPQNTAVNEAEERAVGNPTIRGDVLFFNTIIPNAQVCGFGGAGWLMSIDIYTGGSTTTTVFDVTQNGIVDAEDNIGGINVGQRMEGLPADSSFISDYQYTQSSDKSIFKRKVQPQGENTPSGGLGRLSWQEIRAN